MKTGIDTNVLSSENGEFFGEYMELLINRLTHANMSLERDLGNPDSSSNAIRLKDNMEAFKNLVKHIFLLDGLTEELIIDTANIVNKSSMYISNGYRLGGRKFLVDTEIPISDVPSIPSDMNILLKKYNEEWRDMEVFEKEARFHIAFIRIHPFEDGNGRTGRLILNYNLLRQNTAPVILTTDLEEYYHSYIEKEDVDGMSALFRAQSIRENEVLSELFVRYNMEERKR